MRRKTTPDILVVGPNTSTDGIDMIVGDIHGSLAFNDLLSSLKFKRGDRLFCAGDLIDRGPLSYEVIKAAIGNPGCIFIVRGNHEQLLLDFINVREELIKKNKWSSFLEHFQLNKGIIPPYTKQLIGKNNAEIITNYLENGGYWAFRLENFELTQIKRYLENTPIIIKLPDAFIVHADLPLSKKQIKDRIAAEQLNLDEMEQHHAYWARANGKIHGLPQYRAISNSEVNDPEPVYYGHEIVFRDKIQTTRPGGRINLDFGAYILGVLISITHYKHSKIITLFGEPILNNETNENLKTFHLQLLALYNNIDPNHTNPIVLQKIMQLAAYLRYLNTHTEEIKTIPIHINATVDYTKDDITIILLALSKGISLNNHRINLSFTAANKRATFSSIESVKQYFTLLKSLNIDLEKIEHPQYCLNIQTRSLSEKIEFKLFLSAHHFIKFNTEKCTDDFPDAQLSQAEKLELALHQIISQNFNQPAGSEKQSYMETIPPSEATRNKSIYCLISTALKKNAYHRRFVAHFCTPLSLNDNTELMNENGLKLMLNALTKKCAVDCIQIPIASKDEKSFHTIIIFKNNNNWICAKILISTPHAEKNTLLNLAQTIITNNQHEILTLINPTPPEPKAATEVEIQPIQISTCDKRTEKNFLFTAGAIFAIASRTLSEGVTFLNNTESLKKTINEEHSLIEQFSINEYKALRSNQLDPTLHIGLLTLKNTNPSGLVKAVEQSLSAFMKTKNNQSTFNFFHENGNTIETLGQLQNANQENKAETAYGIAQQIFLEHSESNNPSHTDEKNLKAKLLADALIKIHPNTISKP